MSHASIAMAAINRRPKLKTANSLRVGFDPLKSFHLRFNEPDKSNSDVNASSVTAIEPSVNNEPQRLNGRQRDAHSK